MDVGARPEWEPNRWTGRGDLTQALRALAHKWLKFTIKEIQKKKRLFGSHTPALLPLPSASPSAQVGQSQNHSGSHVIHRYTFTGQSSDNSPGKMTSGSVTRLWSHSRSNRRGLKGGSAEPKVDGQLNGPV